MRLLDDFGIKGVLHFDPVCFVQQWNSLLVCQQGKKFRMLCLCCVTWSLWFERNRAKFESYTLDQESFIQSLKVRIGVWAKALLGAFSFSPPFDTM